LIHNSENHSDVPSCSVAVHFAFIDETAEGQSDDDLVIVPGSEVVVKREARQDNTSTYSYNGKKIVFKELAKKLRELGIDLDHNRFLILQVSLPPRPLMMCGARSPTATPTPSYARSVLAQTVLFRVHIQIRCMRWQYSLINLAHR
jgi:hypothetical protein